jgi:hypothetical protein
VRPRRSINKKKSLAEMPLLVEMLLTAGSSEGALPSMARIKQVDRRCPVFIMLTFIDEHNI